MLCCVALRCCAGTSRVSYHVGRYAFAFIGSGRWSRTGLQKKEKKLLQQNESKNKHKKTGLTSRGKARELKSLPMVFLNILRGQQVGRTDLLTSRMGLQYRRGLPPALCIAYQTRTPHISMSRILRGVHSLLFFARVLLQLRCIADVLSSLR